MGLRADCGARSFIFSSRPIRWGATGAGSSEPAITLPPIVVTRRVKPRAKPRPVQPVSAAPAPVVATPSNLPGTPPIKERYQLPQTAESITAAQHRADRQRHRQRGRGEIPAEPVAAQTQRRRQPDGAGDAHLGSQLECAHAGLCRRHPALGADRQQQHQRHAALGHDRAGGDPAHRLPLRPVLGGLSGQLHGRRAAVHHADAGEVRGDRQAVGIVPDLQPLQHQGHLPHRPEQRLGRQPLGRRVGVRQRQLSEQLQPAARLRDPAVRLGAERRHQRRRSDRRTAPAAPATCSARRGSFTPSRPTSRASSPGTSRRGSAPPTRSASGRTIRPRTCRPISATPPAIRPSAGRPPAATSPPTDSTSTSRTSPTRCRSRPTPRATSTGTWWSCATIISRTSSARRSP